MIKNNFLAGFRKVLPFVLFFIILRFVFDGLSSEIDAFFPRSLTESLNLPDWAIKILGIILMCVLVWVVGLISRQPKVNELSSFWLEPLIYRVPLLNYLYRITNQVANTLELIASFQKVVLVETFPGGYEVGFITGINPEEFCKALRNKELVAVCIPFSPLTSYRVPVVKAEKLKEVNISVSRAITYIVTLGIAGATNQIEKESHFDSEWDFFYF